MNDKTTNKSCYLSFNIQQVSDSQRAYSLAVGTTGIKMSHRKIKEVFPNLCEQGVSQGAGVQMIFIVMFKMIAIIYIIRNK